MKLQKIILCGFKSFADKTEFEFGDGVTIVVGPNGCGKSNIVDAVKWVLGEQSAKSLRGGQMLDVIFNGSSSRKSMGYAEVTLVFSNSTGMLNIETDEVSVTRKLYRSGESDYLVNNKPCRLRDIRELFMDTGIGADAYSIIEQGKVEMLLQASKDDRRAIFEEAAGISKYKARKREALRKLERTEQNVLRLTDIIGELEKRLRSIRYQAGKARNYQAHSQRLNELRLNQFLAEYYQLQNKEKEKQSQRNHVQDELVSVTTSYEQAQARLSVLDDEIAQCEGKIRQAENQLVQCTSQISNQEDRIELGHRRCEELAEQIRKNRGQIRSLREQIQKMRADSEADRQQIEEAEVFLEEQNQQLRQLQDSRQERALQLNENRAQLEDEKSGLIDIVRRTAQLHNEINSLDLRRNNLSGQKDRLHDRHGKIRTEMEELLGGRAQAENKQKRINCLLEDSQKQLETKREQLAQLNEQRLSCSENLAAAKEYRCGLVSRQQLLQDLEAKLEGVETGVKQILEAKQQPDEDKFYYIKGMVADLVQADVKYAAIIEAALADKAQHLVAGSSQAVLEDSENLAELRGRVKIICPDRLGPFINGFDFSPYPEVKGRLVDMVQYPGDSERLAWHLLGKTMLVDSIDSAVRLAQIAPAGYRWVSMSGEVLEADGTIHLGPNAVSVGIISRKSELRQLEESLTDADDRIKELQNQTEQFVNQAHHLENNLQEMRTVIYEANTEKIETRSQLEQIDQNIDRLKREEPLVSTEIDSLEQQMQEAMGLQTSSRQNLDDLETINQQRQEEIDRLEEVIVNLEHEDEQVLDRITEVKVALGQIQQKRLALREKITSVQSQLQQLQHNAKSLEADLEHARENLSATERSILTAETEISQLFQNRQEQQTLSRQRRDKHEELQTEKQQFIDQSRRLNEQKEQLQENLHETQIHLNENHLRQENLIQRAQEDLSLDLVTYFDSYQHEEMDWEAVGTEIEELKQKISRLGNINLDAITEQEELEARAEHLNHELKDLSDARRQLEQLIAKINHESEELFRANFEAIRENFSDLFRKLFGGGRAEIVLEDPENVLECGIEIIARPPGKQLQSISLLSGGEKTMTAVALLMAIFKSKPSPFCLMDEVDAALDEANIERFTLVVQEFLADSQFVIITHSRRTMTIADVIYGITMQEQGVSKKVSVRFAGEEETEEVDTAVA
jgi:chromosome segregation protein